MNFKKLASICLLGAAATIATACSAGNEKASSSSSDVTGEVTIKVAHNMDFVTIPDGIAAAAERLNEKYKEEGRDVHITIEKDYQRIDWDEYMQNVLFATKNGEGPDIFSLAGNLPEHVQNGLVLELDNIDESKFVKGALDSFIVDGKLYAMPFDVPTRAIYFNKDVLRKHGWTEEQIAELPQKIADGSFTWEDFIALNKELVDAGSAKWGMLHRPGKGNDFLDVLREHGTAHYNDKGQLVVDKETVTRFFQFIYDAANTSKITPQDLTQQQWTSIQKMVGDGTAFSYYGPVFAATYVGQEVNQTPEELVKHIGFAVFPKSKYNKQPFTVAAPQAVSINANTKYPEIAKELLEELYKGESVTQLAVHGGTIFSLASVKEANDMKDITENPILKDLGYMADHVITIPPLADEGVYRNELFKQITLLELGQITPEKAYEDFKTQIELNASDVSAIVFKD